MPTKTKTVARRNTTTAKAASTKKNDALPPAEASVVRVGAKKCKPFIIEVMVFSPESGYKFEVAIERSCTPTKDSVWKIVFDLYKQKANGSGFDQLVHVSYRGKSPEENRGIAKTVDGVNDAQAEVIVDEVFPATKEFSDDPSDSNKMRVAEASRRVALAAEL